MGLACSLVTCIAAGVYAAQQNIFIEIDDFSVHEAARYYPVADGEPTTYLIDHVPNPEVFGNPDLSDGEVYRDIIRTNAEKILVDAGKLAAVGAPILAVGEFLRRRKNAKTTTVENDNSTSTDIPTVNTMNENPNAEGVLGDA